MNQAYQFSGGLHGVGISVVNALSKRVEIQIKRDSKIYKIVFEKGEVVDPLESIGKVGKNNTGTKLHFWPEASFFDSPKYALKKLKHLLRAKAVALGSGLSTQSRNVRFFSQSLSRILCKHPFF